MVKWLPVIAAGLIFLSGCAPVVKENEKTMSRIDGETKIEWNKEKYPLLVLFCSLDLEYLVCELSYLSLNSYSISDFLSKKSFTYR